MNYWKLGKVLLLVGILVGAVGVYYIWLRPKMEEKPTPSPSLTLSPTPSPTPTSTLPPKKDEKPPEIKDLRWKPTRVIRSKVYDGRVSFTAEDKDSAISEAYLEFSPVYPLHLPREAFPEETTRRIELKPIDGTLDERVEEFLANITDIKGGREYNIEVTVKDKAGNVVAASSTTPYIREFENIAPLDNISIGAYYYPWYNPNDPAFNFWSNQTEWKKRGFMDNPLCGGYDSSNQLVISKHIDWATGHGIVFFLVSWGFSGPNTFTDIVLRDSIFKNPLITDIKIGILYESNGRLKGEMNGIDLNNQINIETLVSDFDYLSRNYFKHPSFLKINNASAVFCDVSRWYRGDVEKTITMVRDKVRQNGFNLYFITDQVCAYSPEDPDQIKILKAADAVAAYEVFQQAPDFFNPLAPVWTNFDDYTDKTFSIWNDAAKKYDKNFIPTAFPGWDPNPNNPGKNIPILPKSTELLKKQLQIAKKYANGIVMITSFNEWFEQHNIEPGHKSGFEYLQTLYGTLDLDNDTFTNEEEIEFGSDPLVPNPVLKYALRDLKIPGDKELVEILIPVDRDGEMDVSEKAFVDWIENYGENWVELKGLLHQVFADSIVTEDEMVLTDTISIIPTLIPDFKAFERIPERVFQGRDLSGWEITVGDSVWVPPGHEPVSLKDIETMNYGNYSELRANIRSLPIMAHSITYFKVLMKSQFLIICILPVINLDTRFYQLQQNRNIIHKY